MRLEKCVQVLQYINAARTIAIDPCRVSFAIWRLPNSAQATYLSTQISPSRKYWKHLQVHGILCRLVRGHIECGIRIYSTICFTLECHQFLVILI